MADWNKKPEFNEINYIDFTKKSQECDEKRKDINKMIRSTVDYTESRCKRQFRKWLAELVMIVSGISVWIYLICMIIDRMKVLPTEPYRDMNGLELIFAVVTILSAVFAECVRNRNM